VSDLVAALKSSLRMATDRIEVLEREATELRAQQPLAGCGAVRAGFPARFQDYAEGAAGNAEPVFTITHDRDGYTLFQGKARWNAEEHVWDGTLWHDSPVPVGMNEAVPLYAGERVRGGEPGE